MVASSPMSMPAFRLMTVVALIALRAVSAVALPRGVEVRSAAGLTVYSGDSATAAFLIVNHETAPRTVTLTLTCDRGTVTPQRQSVDLDAQGWRPILVHATLEEAAGQARITASVGASSASIDLVRGIDLTRLTWKQLFVPPTEEDTAYAAPSLDDRGWMDLHIPALWNDNRAAWCRVGVRIPAAWKGMPLRVELRAVDDNDITFVNGKAIGRTNGWDTPRSYMVPQEVVRWGEVNTIAVRVDNPTFGGGIHRAPVLLIAGNEAEPVGNEKEPPVAGVARPAPGVIGQPRPLRPLHVDRGVLRYPEGSEVALWGVNIYPQSWHQFENMRRLKLNIKNTLMTDLDHLQQMGVEAIRMHIFDREITDGEGRILENEHLDILDFLVSECTRRGLYLYLTPIAWWGGPNENPASFSAQTSKPGMVFVPSSVRAAAHYLTAFLNRRNPYTNRAYRDEPSLCVLEVMNEPAYFLYGDIEGSGYPPQGESEAVLARDRAEFRRQWLEWCAAMGAEPEPGLFPLFRYDQMRRYIRAMVGAIRAAGARQPIALSFFGSNGDDIVQAIADSECDAVTVSAYPGGWERVNDGHNLMRHAAPLVLDARFNDKARLAYEFDTPATNTSCYLFPALAAHFRAGDVQIACQFQYDSIGTARWNLDWEPHWLNWLYTPAKAVSYMIGGETFRHTPRGVRYDVGTWESPARELRIGAMATSVTANNGVFITNDTALYARSLSWEKGGWMPSRLPVDPRRIVGTGSSPWVDYGGLGAYVLTRTSAHRMRLLLNPDARLVGNSIAGGLSAPVAELESRPHLFRLSLPGWQAAECRPALGGQPVPRTSGGWLLMPGEYEITRKAPKS